MNEQEQLLRFQNVIDQLIDPEKGCPWDKEQTALSMCEYLIEECHELVDAIRSNKPGHACDEMGDLLFVLLLMARRFELAGQFSLGDALKIGADKMVRRHPHVFNGTACDSMDDLMKNWAAIKKAEKEVKAKSKGKRETVYVSAADGAKYRSLHHIDDDDDLPPKGMVQAPATKDDEEPDEAPATEQAPDDGRPALKEDRKNNDKKMK